MKKIIVGIAISVVLLSFSQTSFASPIHNTETGHWYDLVYGDAIQAEAEAVASGGHLVTINDADEQNWLVQNFPIRWLWIGFTDEAQEGNWVWRSGEPVTFTNWYQNEPNNNWGIEDWAYMNERNDLVLGKWNDCRFYIVEAGIAEYVTNPIPEPTSLALLGFGLIGARLFRRKRR